MHLKSKKTIFQLISLFLLFLSCSSCTDQTNQKGELKELQLELIAKENLLVQIETDLEKIVNNARPGCANGTVTVTVDDGPLIELRNEIETLKNKIAELDK